MATPTFAEVWTQIANAIDIIDTIRTDGQTSVVTKLDTFIQSLEGDGAARSGQAARALRASYAGLIGRNRGRQMIDPLLVDLKQAIGSNAPAPGVAFWRDLTEYMIANSQDVNSRNLNLGSVTAGGSNTGDGTIYRLTTDRYNMPIEAVWLDVVTAKCTVDQNGGSKVGKETFRFQHGDNLPDRISEAGSTARDAISGHAGDEILRNASFQSLNGTAASPTGIPNWTSSITVNSSNFTFDESNNFRSSPEEKASGTARSLNIKATATLTQKLSTLNRSLDANVPYMALLRYNRAVGSGAGTLVLRMGSETATVVLAAQTGWQTLALALDQDKWLRQFNEDDLDFQIDWTRTSGDLLVDDVLFGPMQRFDNFWYFVAGGATHFLRDDEFTFTDALTGAEGKIQAWLWRLYNVWLPSENAGGETISDP